MFQANRFIIAHFLSLDEVGIFSVGVQMGSFIDLIANAINIAIFPWIYKNLSLIDNNLNNNLYIEANTLKTKIVKMIYIYTFSLLIISILSYFVLFFLMKYILGPNFHKAIDFLLIFIIAFYFKALYYVFSYFIVYKEKNNFLAIITAITSILSIVLNFYFIKFFGLWGATYAFLITFFIYFLFTSILALKVYNLPLLPKNINPHQ